MKEFNPAVILKISILQSGKVQANGTEIPPDEIESRLTQVQSQNGAVWYYREGAQAQAPPLAKEFVKLVIKHRVPISLSSKPDFSDVIDMHGNSRPR